MIHSPFDNLWASNESEAYGHAQIIRRYLGIEDPRVVIAGAVQHGWSIGTCGHPGSAYTRSCPLYVWNQRSYDAAITKGIEHVHIIGCPVVYANIGLTIEREPGAIVGFPAHSTFGHPFKTKRKTFEEYAEWLARVREKEGFSKATACLHLSDFADVSIRMAFGRYGIDTVTCGPSQGKPNFIETLIGFILPADVITSNYIGTPLFYGALASKTVFLDGPVPVVDTLPNTTEEFHAQAFDREWAKTEFPEFCDGVAGKVCKDVGERELGIGFKKSKQELWDTVHMYYVP